MGQFLRVNGDYNIKTAEGAKIILDTGPAISGGSVKITGDLIVEGQTLSIETNNLNITDNIITLNGGESGPGITLGYSGIQVDRGDTSLFDPLLNKPQNDASLLYDENTNTWIIVHGVAPGPFNFSQSNLRLRTIKTDSSTDGGDLTLIGTGTGLVNVFGTTAYEQEILAREAAFPGSVDDVLPNKKYVDDAIQNQPTFQIVSPQTQDCRIIIADKFVTPNDPGQVGSLAYFTDVTSWTTANNESAISIVVDQELVAQFYDDYVLVGNPGVNGFEIDGTNYEIRTETSITDQNIFIKTAGTGKLQTNNALQLDKVVSPGAYVPGSTIVYAKTPDLGDSGVWFRNDSIEARKRDGELISKNKALVFSMLL